MTCDHVTERYVAETTYLLRNPKQKWYFLNEQRPDEVLLFKNFDSDDDVEAKCAYSWVQQGISFLGQDDMSS